MIIVNPAYAYATSFTLTVDKYYSPYMGADWEISGLRAYQALDDIIASGTVGDTSNCMTFIRSGKFLFEFVLANFGMVIQHEYFGHGARGREFGLYGLGYHFSFLHGKTTYSTASFSTLDLNQQAAFSVGGVEATTILAQQIEEAFFRDGAVDSRGATMFLVNALDESVYAFSTSSSAFHPDNDATAYINYVNAWYANPNALTSHKLKTSVAWSWLNPMLYLSGYSLLKYVFLGYTSFEFCTLHLGDARFLPTTRVLFAPYGPEFQLLVNLYTPDEEYIGVFVRYGKTHGKNSWGVDLIVQPIAVYDCWYLENKLSVWNQPHLLQNNFAYNNTNKYGFGEYIGLYYRLGRGIYAKGELGYKLSGYQPGRQLARGVYWNVGLRFDLDVASKNESKLCDFGPTACPRNTPNPFPR